MNQLKISRIKFKNKIVKDSSTVVNWFCRMNMMKKSKNYENIYIIPSVTLSSKLPLDHRYQLCTEITAA